MLSTEIPGGAEVYIEDPVLETSFLCGKVEHKRFDEHYIKCGVEGIVGTRVSIYTKTFG
jgi:hypothetical protein